MYLNPKIHKSKLIIEEIESRDIIQTFMLYHQPLFRRTDHREENCYITDFLHGRCLRFRNFEKTIKGDCDSTCQDCLLQEDSSYHKLFECHVFCCEERSHILSLVNNTDLQKNYHLQILFTDNKDIRQSFVKLVNYICRTSQHGDQTPVA